MGTGGRNVGCVLKRFAADGRENVGYQYVNACVDHRRRLVGFQLFSQMIGYYRQQKKKIRSGREVEESRAQLSGNSYLFFFAASFRTDISDDTHWDYFSSRLTGYTKTEVRHSQ